MNVQAQPTDKKKVTLTNFVQQVLDNRFPEEPMKRVIDKSERDKLNFACPFCGDSKKRASKKRANLFIKTGTYKCFNDGCNKWMPIRKFVRIFAQKFGIEIDVEIFESEVDAEIPVKVRSYGNPLIAFLVKPKANLVSIPDLLNRFSLKRADELEDGSFVKQKIEERFIHHTPEYGDYFYADTMDNKFYIFNVGLKSGLILGFAVRSLEENVDRRYIIKDYNDLNKIFPKNKVDPELTTEVNTFNNYFNLLNLDFTVPITLLEGQIDSRFISNAIATTGISKSLQIIGSLGPKKNIRVLFDRDKAGKKEMIKMIDQGFSVFMWNQLIDALKRKWNSPEDLKAMQREKLKDINDLYKFMAKRGPINFDAFNEFINPFFSTSPFDLAFI